MCEKPHILLTENYKSLLREIEDLNKWRNISAYILEDVIVKMAVFPKLVYRFNEIPIKPQQASVESVKGW